MSKAGDRASCHDGDDVEIDDDDVEKDDDDAWWLTKEGSSFRRVDEAKCLVRAVRKRHE